MYLQIILKSGRTMCNGLTETVIEVSEVGMRKVSSSGLNSENSFPTVSWCESLQVGDMRQQRLLPLHDGDFAIVKSNNGDVLCTYKGAESPKQRKERLERVYGKPS